MAETTSSRCLPTSRSCCHSERKAQPPLHLVPPCGCERKGEPFLPGLILQKWQIANSMLFSPCDWVDRSGCPRATFEWPTLKIADFISLGP